MQEPGAAAVRRTDVHTRVAALAAVVAFAVAVVGIAVVAARSGDGSGLVRLPVAADASTTARAEIALAPVRYTVKSELPDLPDKAPAYRLDGDDHTGPDVAVSSAPCPVRLPDKPEVVGTCLIGGPPREVAERLARDAFRQLGVPPAGLELHGGGVSWDAVVSPKVGGLPTRGIETRFSIGPKGVTGPFGHVGEPKRIGDYPLVGVQAGLDRLRGDVGIEPAGGVVELTDARLVLLRVDEVLVPAYEYLTDDGAAGVVPAVIDRWLARPAPVAEPEPGGSSGSCSGSGGAAGGDGGNQPMTVEVCVEPAVAKVGQEVVFTVKASDPDARITTEGCGAPTVTFGDEERAVIAQCMAACAAPSRFAPKPRPEPGTFSATHRHAYAKAGTYTARFGFQSTMCNPYSSRGEATATVVVQ